MSDESLPDVNYAAVAPPVLRLESGRESGRAPHLACLALPSSLAARHREESSGTWRDVTPAPPRSDTPVGRCDF
jgi:hypothetical protein